MDRSRSKRFHYDHDFDSETFHRTKQRFNNPQGSYRYAPDHQHHRRSAVAGGAGGRKMQDPSVTVATTYRILCHDVKAGGVIGKFGSIIKQIRQHTGAWVNMHELIPGDEERIIEISDTRRRDPDGRMPSFSPAQEALLLVHERILESGGAGGGYSVGGEEEGGGGGGNNRVVTRLVVSKMHVGSLLGKGGKIIEQMKMETKTHIRILTGEQNLPRCVAKTEEIVQVVGEMNAVKKALDIISSRLRESQHRDRSHFHDRLQSQEHLFSPDDDFIPRMNGTIRRTSVDGSNFGSRLPAGMSSGRSNDYSSENAPVNESGQFMYGEDLVFRILCPVDKVDTLTRESDGILKLLQNEIGVGVKIMNPVASSNEQVIVISSDEGPDDELFPAQEALLHIQTGIVDLVPEKENVIKTRLVVQSDEVGCLGGRDGPVSDTQKIAGASVQILPKEELPACVSGTDEIVQIVGEIKAAREALVEVTSRLRSYIYREFFQKDTPPPGIPASSQSDTVPFNNTSPSQEIYNVKSASPSVHQSVPAKPTAQPVNETEPSGTEIGNQNESERREDMPSELNRIHVPLVTKSILEVVIPPHAAPKLITKSRNKLAQISELSGATVKLIEDRPEETEKIIQISGTPEQAERAQSLLQGFILSTLEDGA